VSSPPSGATVTGDVTAPTTEAGVAVDLIHAIDTQSGGHYRIATTPDNLTLLETWMDNEGGLWADNPLNTSLDALRYPHQITSSGVDTRIPIFPDIQIGVAATATTLLADASYAGILSVLSTGTASCDTFARVVMASPWAASHYGGDPSHFCGTTGSPGTGAVAPACLRLRGRSRAGVSSSRMPGSCGRSGSTVGRALSDGHRHAARVTAKRQGAPKRRVAPGRQKAKGQSASGRHRTAATPSASGRPAVRHGDTARRR
jgi:hypothetical protein